MCVYMYIYIYIYAYIYIYVHDVYNNDVVMHIGVHSLDIFLSGWNAHLDSHTGFAN